MTDKLLGHLATHVSLDVEAQIKTLADFAGVSPSEYVRSVLQAHLAEKRRQYESLSRAFGAPGSVGAERSSGAS